MLHGFIAGPILFNTFMNIEGMPMKFVDDTG